jgi:hypothetical protein
VVPQEDAVPFTVRRPRRAVRGGRLLGTAVVVASALTPDAAVQQLGVGRVGNRWYPRFTSTQGLRPVIVGRVSADDVHLRVRRTARRNAWRPVLRGRFEASPGGSRFVGSFGWATSVRIGTAAWFSVVGLTMTVQLEGAVLVAGFGLAVLAAVLCALGTRCGRADETVIRDWLTERIGGV